MFNIPAGGVSTAHLYSMRELTSNPSSACLRPSADARPAERLREVGRPSSDVPLDKIAAHPCALTPPGFEVGSDAYARARGPRRLHVHAKRWPTSFSETSHNRSAF